MSDPFDPATVRLWCKSVGIEVGERGRISDLILAKFLKAGMPSKEQTLAAHPELAPAIPVSRVVRTTTETNNEGVSVTSNFVVTDEVPQRRGKKTLLPHHYDPRASLFSADHALLQKFWGIETNRALWFISDMDDLTEVLGEPSDNPSVTIGEQIGEDDA